MSRRAASRRIDPDFVAETSGTDWCFSYRQVDDAVIRMREVVAAGRPADVAPVEQFSPRAAFAPILARLG